MKTNTTASINTKNQSERDSLDTVVIIFLCLGAGDAYGSKSTLVDSRLIYPIPSAIASVGFEKKDTGWK